MLETFIPASSATLITTGIQYFQDCQVPKPEGLLTIRQVHQPENLIHGQMGGDIFFQFGALQFSGRIGLNNPLFFQETGKKTALQKSFRAILVRFNFP